MFPSHALGNSSSRHYTTTWPSLYAHVAFLYAEVACQHAAVPRQ